MGLLSLCRKLGESNSTLWWVLRCPLNRVDSDPGKPVKEHNQQEILEFILLVTTVETGTGNLDFLRGEASTSVEGLEPPAVSELLEETIVLDLTATTDFLTSLLA